MPVPTNYAPERDAIYCEALPAPREEPQGTALGVDSQGRISPFGISPGRHARRARGHDRAACKPVALASLRRTAGA